MHISVQKQLLRDAEIHFRSAEGLFDAGDFVACINRLLLAHTAFARMAHDTEEYDSKWRAMLIDYCERLYWAARERIF